MQIVTTHEAKTHLSRLLAAVEKGEEILIARGKKVVARLVPETEANAQKARPKVGDIIGEPFEFSDAAFAPISDDELRDVWGL